MSNEPNTRIPYRKPLIIKQSGETMSLFWKRAELTGVGRECTRCGAKRRFSRLKCHHCSSKEHVQVKINSIDKSFPPEALETLADIMGIERPRMAGMPSGFKYEELNPEGSLVSTESRQTAIADDVDISDLERLDPTNTPSVRGVNLSPPPKPQHDDDVEDNSRPKPKQSYEDMTREELTLLLSSEYGVDVPSKWNKSKIISTLQEVEREHAAIDLDDSDLSPSDLPSEDAE
jgi:hypothetical protein